MSKPIKLIHAATRRIKRAPRRVGRTTTMIGSLSSAVTAAAVLTGCGGSTAVTHRRNSTLATTVSVSASGVTPAVETGNARVPHPSMVVARVGSQSLTMGMLQHLIGLDVATEIPARQIALVPPSFSSCISHLAVSKGTVVRPSSSKLKAVCKERYEKALELEEAAWILGEWSIHGADELGVHVGHAAVQTRYQNIIRRGYKSFGEFAKKLTVSGETKADVFREMQVTLAGERMRAAIKRKAHALTSNEVASYFRSHPSQFVVPQRRDVEIVRSKTKAVAAKIKREVASGKSFASAADASLLQQPLFAKHGLVRDLKIDSYSAPKLERAIFRARRNVLYGPVEEGEVSWNGWYVFEVKTIHPGRRKTLKEVAASLRHSLIERRFNHDIVSFTKRWRAKWRAQTYCSSRYIVSGCSGYKPPPGAHFEEDPYAL